MTTQPDDWLEANIDELVAIRRDIHAHPELGFEETRAAAIVADKLRELDIEVHEGVGGTGVVGIIAGRRPGDRSIGLRADMDALAIHEATGAATHRRCRAGCTPAAMTGTPRCCWGRRASWRATATSPGGSR